MQNKYKFRQGELIVNFIRKRADTTKVIKRKNNKYKLKYSSTGGIFWLTKDYVHKYYSRNLKLVELLYG